MSDAALRSSPGVGPEGLLPRLRYLARDPFWTHFLRQVYFTFVQAIPLVGVSSLLVGLAVAFQARAGLSLLGGDEQVGRMMIVVVFREVAPLAAGVILAARSVTAVAAEVATMKMQQEIEALELMGIAVRRYLLWPRVAAGPVSLFAMTVTFFAMSLVGGWFGANAVEPVPWPLYWGSTISALQLGDFGFFALKTAGCGVIFMVVACRRGLSLVKAPYEVPIVTHRAVVEALTLGLGTQIGLSFMYYSLYGLRL